jgi:hypothetical protein
VAGIILVSGSLASLLAMPALSWTIRTGGDFETVNFLAMLLGVCSLYLPAFCYYSEQARNKAAEATRQTPHLAASGATAATMAP